MDKNLKKPEIFILDDSFEHIKFISGFLRENNYCVRAAIDVENFFDNIKKSIPDLILLDIMLPDTDGFTICKLLKEDEKTKEIPVIFLTSMEDKESTLKGFEVGGQDYIQKPVDLNILLARVNTHIRLKQKSQKLSEAYKDIENFNHMVCHDLKAPLWSIRNLSQFIYEECHKLASKDTIDLLDGLKNKSEEAVTLIEKLSEISKLSRNFLSLEKVNMNEVFNDSYRLLIEGIKDRNIEFRMNKLWEVYADRILIKQVTYNILSNAIKFTKSCENAIITVDNYVDRNELVVLVTDNGIGFDMKYAYKLFNMFQRLHSVEEYDGVGAGLAIVKKIINKHGGRIWINSEEGHGTKVNFTLPIKSKNF